MLITLIYIKTFGENCILLGEIRLLFLILILVISCNQLHPPTPLCTLESEVRKFVSRILGAKEMTHAWKYHSLALKSKYVIRILLSGVLIKILNPKFMEVAGMAKRSRYFL